MIPEPKDIKTSDEPFDRLTELANEMLKLVDDSDVRAIVFLEDSVKAGIAFGGYQDSGEGIAALLAHLKIMFEAKGAGFNLLVIGKEGPELL